MSYNKKRKHYLDTKELTLKALLIRCIIFTMFFCIFSIILALIFTLIGFNSQDPTSKIDLFGTIALLLSVFFSGFIMSKVNKEKYFIGSLILGIMILLLTTLASLLLPSNEEATIMQVIWKLIIPVVCILGGMLGIKRESKNHRRRNFTR